MPQNRFVSAGGPGVGLPQSSEVSFLQSAKDFAEALRQKATIEKRTGPGTVQIYRQSFSSAKVFLARQTDASCAGDQRHPDEPSDAQLIGYDLFLVPPTLSADAAAPSLNGDIQAICNFSQQPPPTGGGIK